MTAVAIVLASVVVALGIFSFVMLQAQRDMFRAMFESQNAFVVNMTDGLRSAFLKAIEELRPHDAPQPLHEPRESRDHPSEPLPDPRIASSEPPVVPGDPRPWLSWQTEDDSTGPFGAWTPPNLQIVDS